MLVGSVYSSLGGFNYKIHDASLFFHEVHNKKRPVDGRPCVFFLTLKPHWDDPNLLGTCLGMCGPATETDVSMEVSPNWTVCARKHNCQSTRADAKTQRKSLDRMPKALDENWLHSYGR